MIGAACVSCWVCALCGPAEHSVVTLCELHAGCVLFVTDVRCDCCVCDVDLILAYCTPGKPRLCSSPTPSHQVERVPLYVCTELQQVTPAQDLRTHLPGCPRLAGMVGAAVATAHQLLCVRRRRCAAGHLLTYLLCCQSMPTG